MARKLPIQYAGAVYHVMSRGDRREAIFRDHRDRRRFQETLDEVCLKTGWQVHASCQNNDHVVGRAPLGEGEREYAQKHARAQPRAGRTARRGEVEHLAGVAL